MLDETNVSHGHVTFFGLCATEIFYLLIYLFVFIYSQILHVGYLKKNTHILCHC